MDIKPGRYRLPRRLLDANYFDSYNTSLAYNWQQNRDVLQTVEIKGYDN